MKYSIPPEFQDSTLDTCEMVSNGWDAPLGGGNRAIKRRQHSQSLIYTGFLYLTLITLLPVFSTQLQCTQTRLLPSESEHLVY